MVAFGESFLIRRGGWEVVVSFGTGTEEALFAVVDGDILGRLARGDFGADGGACLLEMVEG